jgi:EAL domain-containing protein (putative c-di-GMP-specific phosphodiesterase class I)/DNA-binding response OmpR family regulator/GGDEF domain-containing protein
MNSETAVTTILMADDDPSHLLLAEAALAGAGFMVHTVGDGAEAVEQFDQVKPDFVILDVNMPRMSGIEACRELRSRTGNRILPILMLTGRNDLPVIGDAFAAGASDFAQKGLNPRLLVERVRFLLRDRDLQQELVSSRSKLLLAQRIARVGHWELSVEGRTLHVSPMVGEILGVDPGALRRFEDFVRMLGHAEQVTARQAFIACATGDGYLSLDHILQTSGGATLSVHAEAELVRTTGSTSDGTVIVTFQDLTRLHRAEDAVRQLSYFDTGTGLPNRRHMAEQIPAALKDRAGIIGAAVVAVRLHGFDQIVQAQGIESANKLVARIARSLERELASVSQGGAIPWRAANAVCRTADGELSMLLCSRVSSDHLAGVARAILESVSTHGPAADSDYTPPLSAGIAFAEGDHIEPEVLLQNAHAAAEHASEPRSCEVYSSVPQARSRRRLVIESALRGAVDRREMSISYQPRVAVDTYELTGVECDVRWENAQVGAISREEFMAIADGAGIGDEIGRWVVGEACRQVAAWRKRFEREFFVSARFSARQIRDPGFVAFIRETLETHSLPTRALEIAVTEASVVEAPREARAALDALRLTGVGIAIDDFGAGHSSLSQIRRLPVDCMKLGRSLMSDLYIDMGAQGVIAAVLAMARGMRVRSVADGIEDAATLQLLGALGCDEVQGPYISPPLGPRAFEEWLQDGGATALTQQQTMDIIDALEAAERTAAG